MTPAYTATSDPDFHPIQTTVFEWEVHLLRRQPKRLLGIVAALIAIFLTSLFLFHSFWLALLPVVAALGTLSEYLFPIHYTLTELSAKMNCGLILLEIRWADVRHAYITDEGIKLSPLCSRNSRMEPLRGVYLRFDLPQREAIQMEVKHRLEQERTRG